MKQIIFSIICVFLVMSCNNAPEQETQTPVQGDITMYIGKFVGSDSSEGYIKKLEYHKGSYVYVMKGCECSDEVGEHSNTSESTTSADSTKDSSVVKMIVAGDMIEFLKSIDKKYLPHLYFYYLYTSDLNTGKSGAIIVSAFFDLEDITPLEKVTKYTAGKSMSVIMVGKNPPNKAPVVDTTKVSLPPVVTKEDTVVKEIKKDTIRKR